jgi:PAS fold
LVTCLRTGSAGETPFRVRNAAGEYRWFLTRAEPLRASDGTLLYWIGVNLEIDERKQAEFYLAEGQRLAHMGSWVFNPAGSSATGPVNFFAYTVLIRQKKGLALTNTWHASIPRIASSWRR